MSATALNRAIERAGGVVAFARRMKCSHQLARHWVKRGLPPKHCRRVERLTGIPRAELRPDIFA